MQALRLLIGSCLVYGVVAACSGGSEQAALTVIPDGGQEVGQGGAAGYDASGGATGASGSEGGIVDASRDTFDAVADALLDPVPEADAQDATSGTRLRARRYVANDGATQFVGWYDSLRQVNCLFRSVDSGQFRCLPTDLAPYTGLFSDANCTNPAFVAGAVQCGEKYGVIYSPGVACNSFSGAELHRVGAWQATVYSDASGSCQAVPSLTEGGHASAGLVPVTDFVGATEQLD